MKSSLPTAAVPALLCAFLMLTPIAALAAETGEAEFAKGWDLLKQKQYQEARAVLEAGMKKNPSNALAQYYLAEACKGLKDWSCAEEHYETSLDLDGKSSVADLAKARLKKTKVWRLLDQAKRSLYESGTPVEKVSEAKDGLEIASTMGLDDEQKAVYENLKKKLDEKDREKSEVDSKAKGQESLRKLEGRWKFIVIGGLGLNVYRASVNDQGELEMRLEQLAPRASQLGVKVGAKWLFGFVPYDPSYFEAKYYKEAVTSTFRAGVAFYAKGYKLEVFDYPKKGKCQPVAGWKPLRHILAYVREIDTIRLLQRDRILRDDDNCDVSVEDMTHKNDFFSGTNWIQEMVRVQE